jgi:hypothetical protein
MKIVTSINHLKTLCNIDGFAEFYIVLSVGLAKSSKRIKYYSENNTFDIYNEIDGTWQEDITVEDLYIETNIMEAIEKKALIYTGFQLQGIY